MNQFTRIIAAFCCISICIFSETFAQNLALSTQNPPGLYVCGIDQVSVTVQNTNGSPAATSVQLVAILPLGVTYEPGTVTGATEFNISNLSSPVFAMADLPGGATNTVRFSIKAGCSLVGDINNGQVFSNTFVVNYTGGTKQITSNTFIIETGLANLISVNPVTAAGVKGDVIMRTITLKNTREGPIHSLSFRDQHTSGLSIQVVGAINENDQATLYTGEIPGSYFTQFGDGDDLLENTDGEITIIEKVTITACGIPTYTAKSDIIVGWGCDATTCRSDSLIAQINILPTNENPDLTFVPVPQRPFSYCGDVPSMEEITIHNNGQLPASNVEVMVFTYDTLFMAFDPSSFEWSNDGVTWTPVNILSSFPTPITTCDMNGYVLSVTAVVPFVDIAETVRLRYKTYHCVPVCYPYAPFSGFTYKYPKACPPQASTTGLTNILSDTSFLQLNNGFTFDIGHCLETDSFYSLEYWIKSKRLLIDTGVIRININLPKGLSFDPSCNFSIDGQTPLDFDISVNAQGTTTIDALFDLPFSSDSVGTDFCIQYVCQPDMPCLNSNPTFPPRNTTIDAYPPENDCNGCELPISLSCSILLDSMQDSDCGISACEVFTMVVDDSCNDGGGGIGSGSGDLVILVGFDSWRLNKGFQDDNNDRQADSNNKANSPNIRLDRFLVGDTMRNELRITVLSGQLEALDYRFFLESMMSDFGVQDGDSISFFKAQNMFTNYDSTIFVGGNVIIQKSTGEMYECPGFGPNIRSDQHTVNISIPNIKPKQIVDKMISMFDQYRFDINSAIASGCVPQGTTLEAGDQVFLQADYKFTNNFTPEGSSTPPLVNFRTSVCDQFKTFSWKLEDFCTVKPLLQFSGFIETFVPAIQRLEPCKQSTEIVPFNYRLRIARGNMFPFEVRPITRITQYSHSLPLAVDLLKSELGFLRLQENTILFSGDTLLTTSNGGFINYQLDDFFDDALDEGYSMEINTVFDTICGYEGASFGQTNVGVHYSDMCLHNPVDVVYELPNPNSYVSGSPQLDFFNVGLNTVFIQTNDVELDFTIRNASPVTALNAWIIIDSDNNLTDLELFIVDPPNLVPVPQIGGVYQLDSLPAFAQPFFKLRAKSISCGPFTVNYRFGWGCTPTFNERPLACGEFMGSVEIRPQIPELELIILKEQSPLVLCSPSDDFEFEILNANEGSAYNVVPSVKLPQGFIIVPGSSRLSFPAGVGAPINMPDPVQLPGNIYQFDPQAVSPTLAQNGLVSFEQEPLNAMRILFKIQAECGAVANAQPIYGAEAIQPCGLASNRLRKPGQPIAINGVNAVNEAVANLSFADPNHSIGCGEVVELSASIQLDGPASAGDSIYVSLPSGTSYVSGSYMPGANAPTQQPSISGQSLQWPIPTNLGNNAILTFTFSVRYDDPAGCIDKFVTLQTREKTQAQCMNVQCPVYVASSEALLNLTAENPEMQLNNFQLQTDISGQTGFTANLENLGNAAASNPVVQIYHDQNGNGVIDPTDPLVSTVSLNGTTLIPGTTIGINGDLNNLDPSAYCSLIALIPAEENCACDDKVFPLDGNQVVTSGIGLCNPQMVSVGTDSIAGNTYTWLTTGGIGCPTCANTTYTPGPDVMPGDLITLVLIEQTGICEIERRFDIQFGGSFGIETTDLTICEGQSATLEATPGGSNYNWSGPGITNPNQQTQVVSPIGNTNYSVTVTFADGCTGTGSVTVFVDPAINISIEKTTCAGTPIQLFDGLITDVAGVYTGTLASANGCDTLVTVTLTVPEMNTETIYTGCEGDTLLINSIEYTTSGTNCTDYTTSNGCDSTHCDIVTFFPNPNLPAQDSVIVQAGTEITLDGPSGFDSYSWSPEGSHLSCSDCEDPIATPDSTTNFILTVTDNHGCRDSVTYRVVTCDVDKYLEIVPNAFTPNNDGYNDFFRPVPTEGAEMIVSLQVYNRWGTKIYEGNGAGAAWNGKVNGKDASSDVYVYILVVECNGVQRQKHGEISLLR
ncbi:MAG: gliding motility-associated C-terminal domain-containing protein [Saprospiraceae bacterium]